MQRYPNRLWTGTTRPLMSNLSVNKPISVIQAALIKQLENAILFCHTCSDEDLLDEFLVPIRVNDPARCKKCKTAIAAMTDEQISELNWQLYEIYEPVEDYDMWIVYDEGWGDR